MNFMCPFVAADLIFTGGRIIRVGNGKVTVGPKG